MAALKAVGDNKGKDLAYDALSGIVSRSRLRRNQLPKPWCSTLLPVVILRGSLCVASWDGTFNRLRVRPADACVMHFRADVELVSTGVLVATLASLPELLGRVRTELVKESAFLTDWLEKMRTAVENGTLVTEFEVDVDDPNLPDSLREPLLREAERSGLGTLARR